MSRSRRKTPICGVVSASSEKRDKRLWHGAFRAAEKRFLRAVLVDPDVEDGLAPPVMSDVSNPWGMAKDGKFWFGPRRHSDAWGMKDPAALWRK